MSDSAETVLKELARVIDAREGRRAGFAGDVGIGQAYLSQILNGRRPIGRLPVSTVRKISDVSGISLDRLTSPTLASEGAQ